MINKMINVPFPGRVAGFLSLPVRNRIVAPGVALQPQDRTWLHSSAGTTAFSKSLPRFGYATRGAVYGLAGALAALAALGSGGQTGGSESAVRTLIDEPFGKLMLGAIASGLAGFGLWRFVQSITDADRRGTSMRGLAIRSGQIIGGFLVLAAFRSNSQEARGLGGALVALQGQPYGWVLPGIVAAGLFFGDEKEHLPNTGLFSCSRHLRHDAMSLMALRSSPAASILDGPAVTITQMFENALSFRHGIA